jgi:hypothetical protein
MLFMQFLLILIEIWLLQQRFFCLDRGWSKSILTSNLLSYILILLNICKCLVTEIMDCIHFMMIMTLQNFFYMFLCAILMNELIFFYLSKSSKHLDILHIIWLRHIIYRCVYNHIYFLFFIFGIFGLSFEMMLRINDKFLIRLLFFDALIKRWVLHK